MKILKYLISFEDYLAIHFNPLICHSLSGGNATFPNILNNFVHVCMYFYYMVSAMGPQFQKYLWWKKYMTELQIVSIDLSYCRTKSSLSKEFLSFLNYYHHLRVVPVFYEFGLDNTSL